MPIPLQNPIVEHVGNGVTTVFAYPFGVLAAADLKVRVAGVDITSGYTVSGVGNRAGGTVTFAAAPANGAEVLLFREVQLKRDTDYQENGDLREDVLDDDFDRIWMALQDQLLIASRTLRAPVGETFADLPAASGRALRVLGFDAQGAPILLSRTDDGGAALALDLLGGGGSSLVGFQQSGSGAVARTVQDKARESVSVKDFGAVGDGVADDTSAIQAAIDAVTLAGGGVVVAPPGAYLIAGDGIINIKANVILRGAGAATRFVSGTGGRNGNHVFVYLKDGAAIEDCRLSGSNFIRQSGGPDFIAFNKVGITTQGAATGVGIRVRNVGFEKFGFSHVFVFDGHRNVTITGCYTFGTQVGSYANVDANYEVVSWNATLDAGKLADGSQAYCLTNFYNSGTGTADVVISGGVHFNINDAFVGINGNAVRHVITDNVFVKDTAGYYGGWGVDINTGDSCVVSGNYIRGGSYGCHLFGSKSCTVTGNTFETDRGVWVDDPSSELNTISGNTITLSSFSASVTPKIGIDFVGGVNNIVVGNSINGASIAGAKGILFSSGAIGNSITANQFANMAVGIESSGSATDANFSFTNTYRNVTTRFPRQINSNFFQDVRGISGNSTNANNLGGAVTITDTATSQAVTFANIEPDANYRIMMTPRSSSGTPASGSFVVVAPTSVSTNGFTANVQAAPGAGNSVTYNWFLYRA